MLKKTLIAVVTLVGLGVIASVIAARVNKN